MGRKKRKNNSKEIKDFDNKKSAKISDQENSNWPGPKLNLKEQTKYAALSILCLALAVFFLLSRFDQAGIAGRNTYQAFDGLFGGGYFLLPIIFLFWAVSFFRSMRPNFMLTRLLGGLLLFISGLGLASILFGDEAGGLVGQVIAGPIVAWFDVYISVVFLSALSLISLLIVFDADLSWETVKKLWSKDTPPLPLDELSPNEDKAADKMLTAVAQAEDQAEKENAQKEESTRRKLDDRSNNKNDDGLFASLMSFGRKGSGGKFSPPPLELLERDSGKVGAGDIKANMNIIKRTLLNFGINVEMDEVSIGPSVTRYALKPAEGMKLSRIVNLQNDLSLALAAHPLRIEAPIPGKSLVGIEIPNKTKATVGLASMLGTPEFQNSPHPLYVALGKGISGLPQYANLAKAPHMLIAGATGSGKSVTIHTIITSLLYRNPPENMRFIMVDPKRVELTLYNKIPHLLTPVITDAKKAIVSLRWAAKEMDRRYDILEANSVRDIQSYHKNILAPALADADKKPVNNDDETPEIERMPYIVIIIDELADIMTSYPRELEAAIVRLAQMSRAVGIHLLLSTQRPSVEVITGLIKANIPSRIALQVASQIDSRTIIDMAGAEKLLGAGDMLFMSGEMSKPVRVQSAFISEAEVKKVVSYLAENYRDEVPTEINLDMNEAITSSNKASFATALDNSDSDDDLYEEARMAVLEAGKASASYLQRKLKVGYARAARLLDMLEERGVIGAGDGAKPRQVFDQKPSETLE